MVGVLLSVRMSVDAVSLTRKFCKDALTTEDIHAAGNRLQVFRVHAWVDTTQVVNLKALRDRSDNEFVSKPMSHDNPNTVPKRPYPLLR